MRLRSLLFVPGDRPDRMEKGLEIGADALILDLEDSVALQAKPQARIAVATFLRSAQRKAKLFVRVNPLDSGFIDDDLAAVLDSHPDGLVLPKAEGAESIRALAARCQGIPILPIVTETPSAVFKIGSYAEVEQALLGLTWGAEDLPSAIGASTARDENSRYLPPYELVRSLTLFGAHAANVAAIETVYPSFRDLEGLRAYAKNGRRDGFTGMMAIHPDQVPIINDAFNPSEDEIAHAKQIVAAFAANPNQGVLQLDGRMIDLPHLKLAQRVLRMVGSRDN
jgi:citrate lyase subunit beta/citryl-CoA lyase